LKFETNRREQNYFFSAFKRFRGFRKTPTRRSNLNLGKTMENQINAQECARHPCA
jgi:hypothetical protein